MMMGICALCLMQRISLSREGNLLISSTVGILGKHSFYSVLVMNGMLDNSIKIKRSLSGFHSSLIVLY